MSNWALERVESGRKNGSLNGAIADKLSVSLYSIIHTESSHFGLILTRNDKNMTMRAIVAGIKCDDQCKE